MDQRLQNALDGDIDGEALTPQERKELYEAESAFDAVLRAVPVESLPDMTSAVLRRIQERQSVGGAMAAAEPHSDAAPLPRGNLTDWLWRPRAVSINWRPAYALAAAAVLLIVVAAESLRPERGVAAGSHQVFTQFVLRAPDAKNVALAGDFTEWQPAYTMTRSEPGVWTVVVPLDPGIHSYSFVVDGERWVPDPMAPAFEDGFGGVNSRVAVLTPDEGRS